MEIKNFITPQKNIESDRHSTQKIDGIVTISPGVDFGHGLNIANYKNEINEAESKPDAFNSHPADPDSMAAELREAEKKLKETTQRFIAAITSTYGRDSIEYGKAGCVRTSKIRHHS